MSHYVAPLRDIGFALNEVFGFAHHYANLPQGQDATEDLVSAILEEAGRFAQHELAPLNAIGDQQGCQWRDGQVTTAPGFRQAYQKLIEGGWLSLAQDPAWGGQGLPPSLASIVTELFSGANHAWTMYPNLSLGAMSTVQAHGSEALKARVLPNLVDGRWSGTMCLTEAHCGSDLGLLRTRAEPQDDGSYRITGSKMFISAGEHDLTENIIHVVLARLPDSPAGVKGITLFLVPKLGIDDTCAGQPNGVSCGSLEHKMGIHGNATCVMNFDGAKGYLLGEVNKGMACMFTFINESRLQMRTTPRANPAQPADPIIAHPDVRRMLLTQKAFSEGGRLLNYYCAKYVDIAHGSKDEHARETAQSRLALLTPIAKGFLSEVAQEAASHGIQVLGGHGYIAEWGLEQIARDVRITSIYEGTTGIQALDLLGRKILPERGALLEPFIDEIRTFCADADRQLEAYTVPLLGSLNAWAHITQQLADRADHDSAVVGAASVDYLLYAGYVTLAYLWARSASVALRALQAGTGEAPFYQTKLHTARFYFERILPRTRGLLETLQASPASLMSVDPAWFLNHGE